MATACQWLDARTGRAWLAEDLGLLIPLVFPDMSALLLGHSRYAKWRGYPKQLAINQCQNI
jgi:hypothetical protein